MARQTGSQSRAVRVAMIGAGPSALRFHYPSLAEMPDVEIAAVCDLDPQRRESAAADFDIPQQYEAYRQMLDREAPDAVYIVVFPEFLDPLVTDCLERGFHTFVEKPPGITSDQTKHWADLAADKSLLTMAAFNRRFDPVTVEVRKRVEARKPIRSFLIELYKFYSPQASNELHARNGFLPQGSHHVDLLRWLGGEPVEISSFPDRHYATWMNSVTAIVRFDSGATGTLIFQRGSGFSRRERIVLHADQITGVAEIAGAREGAGAHGVISDNQSVEELQLTDVVSNGKHHHEYGYFQENRHFIDCLKSGRQPETNFADGVKTMELIEALARPR